MGLLKKILGMDSIPIEEKREVDFDDYMRQVTCEDVETLLYKDITLRFRNSEDDVVGRIIPPECDWSLGCDGYKFIFRAGEGRIGSYYPGIFPVDLEPSHVYNGPSEHVAEIIGEEKVEILMESNERVRLYKTSQPYVFFMHRKFGFGGGFTRQGDYDFERYNSALNDSGEMQETFDFVS